jgi:hypothetical protein
LQRISAFAQAAQNGGQMSDVLAERAARQRAMQEEEQARILGDRLRARLSPMDGPNGSGTGAMPSIEEQMAALEEARLLNPQVAEQFAPVVTQRRMAQLTQGRPIEEQLAVELNPEQAGRSYATQFEDMPLAAGTVRSRGPQSVAAAPVTQRFDDRYGTYNPLTGETTYSQPRGMTEDERTRRIAAERPQVASAGVGVELYGVGPSGQVTPLAANTQPRPMSDADQTAIGNAEVQIEALNTSLTRAQEISRQIEAGELNLGLVENLVSGGRNLLGMSDQNSLNYDALLNWAKDARNAVLQSNTGVQTDQDAIRELDTILSGTRDERIVRAALARFVEARSATRQALERNIARRAGQPTTQQGSQQSQGASRRAYDAQGNSYVVRNGQWVRE